MMLMRCFFFVFFFLVYVFFLFLFLFFCDFLYRSICCGHLFELHQHVDAIQMGTLNISRQKVHWLKSGDYEIA